jgi:hypothetical protein
MKDVLEIKNLSSRMQPHARHLLLKMARLYFTRWPAAHGGKQHLSLILPEGRLIEQPLGHGQCVIQHSLGYRVNLTRPTIHRQDS